MITLYSNATGLKSALASVDDLADYLEGYRVTGRHERADDVAYEIQPTTFTGVTNVIAVDNDETDALALMEAGIANSPAPPPERLTQERPTAPYRADCGHLCNCYPFEHDGQPWYEHDMYDTYADDGRTVTGTECGRCYRARMDAMPAMEPADIRKTFIHAINL